jgi:hypothetical protein
MSSAPIPEGGGVSGEAIVCARWQFGAAGANIAVVAGDSMSWWQRQHDVGVTGRWYSSLANNI